MAGKRRRQHSSGGVPVWVWLAVSGGALALVLVVVLVVVLGRGPAGAGMPGSGFPGGGFPGVSKKVAWNDFVAIRQGMTADEVRGVLGTPGETREEREGTVMIWEGKVGGDYVELTFRGAGSRRALDSSAAGATESTNDEPNKGCTRPGRHSGLLEYLVSPAGPAGELSRSTVEGAPTV